MKARQTRGSKMKIVPIRAAAPVLQKGADAATRQELARVLGSATFRQVDRLKRFLNFIVNEAVEGRGDQLKEYVIGVQVFDKDSSFDPRADPIVRVQARRLRSRLVRYYREEGGTDAVVIELPKGGYGPVFRNRETAGPGRRTTGPAIAGQNTIAVLPFADHSAERDLAYFCDGLRHEIIHRLAKVTALRVLALQPDGINGAPDAPDTSAQAAMLLTGGVRKSGERLRATVHLVDSATASYLWSESLDVALADIFAAQESVADLVVKKLEPRLVDAGQRRAARRPAENLAARNLYLQGRYQMNQRTEEGLRKAVDFFERAIVEDSHYALAHSGLADAYGLLTHYGVFGPADVWTRAASSAASAVMLDPDSSEAHTSLAHVKSTQDWDWSGAEREFQLAITLDPGYATAHHWYAMSCLVPMGRLDEALDEMLLAQSLDPVSSIVARDLALVDLFRRDLEAALEQCDQAIELNPHFSPAYWTLGLVQEQRNDFDEAAAAFQRAIHLSPQTPRMQAALARTYALAGKRKESAEILRRLESLSEQRYISPFEFACMRFALGQTDLGFRSFMKACEDRSFELLWMRVDPRLDPIRSDKRFEAAARQMRLA
jgi:TolB-like protein/Flp pilus assembly protein TadD